MPYELSFTKQLDVTNPARYINECCVGGDLVLAALLPALEARYGQLDTGVGSCGLPETACTMQWTFSQTTT